MEFEAKGEREKGEREKEGNRDRGTERASDTEMAAKPLLVGSGDKALGDVSAASASRSSIAVVANRSCCSVHKPACCIPLARMSIQNPAPCSLLPLFSPLHSPPIAWVGFGESAWLKHVRWLHGKTAVDELVYLAPMKSLTDPT
jgi:hypothetical protein